MRPLFWRLLLCLTLGALVTLASTWLPFFKTLGAKTVRSASRPLSEGTASPFLIARLTETTCADRLSVTVWDHIREYAPASSAKTPASPSPEVVLAGPLMTHAWPSLVDRFRSGAGPFMLTAEASGWPMRAFWCESEWPLGRSVRGGLVVGTLRAGPQKGAPFVLPYLPIWSGLAIDVGFWSSAAAPLVFAPVVIRRLRRKRRGACTACGYDLSGLPVGATCPECGRGAAPAPRE